MTSPFSNDITSLVAGNEDNRKHFRGICDQRKPGDRNSAHAHLSRHFPQLQSNLKFCYSTHTSQRGAPCVSNSE